MSRRLSAVVLCALVLLAIVGPIGSVAARSSPQYTPLPYDHANLSSTGVVSRTISYSYDAAGRLVIADYGTLLIYSYDESGNLLSVSNRLTVYVPLVLRAYR